MEAKPATNLTYQQPPASPTGMTQETIDVCVITTIHGNYDARIYDRGVRVLTEAGLRVGFVGPWPYDARSGIERENWHVTTRAPRRWLRPWFAMRTLFTALRVKA